ncbi:uncharacterized protein AB675_2418 [Cyphellophora attinorum]|uniref:Something about silencing protein 4 domain-containing protein n=1 Tax=Cyphellophora attinorum TaxID=1664694 RepID=A0A0N1HB04_9EURO|nr:uncharacterized protein AB675_2418 [Phialophora attinorum]KPI45277.1 hypothetical protein AB675_2418 [Phialophora attinorum]
MVELRRQTRPSAPPPTTNENDPHDSSDATSLRSKRNRAVSAVNGEQQQHQELHKRRKLANNLQPQKLRIPLRGRTGLQPKYTKSAPEKSKYSHQSAGELPTPATSIDSPTPKAQYDQFRRVEEKARASIRENKTGDADNKNNDRRRLRSEHGGTRIKTELAQFIPNFEEMLSLEPPDPTALTAHTRVTLLNDTPDYDPPPPRSDPFAPTNPSTTPRSSPSPPYPMAEDRYLKSHAKAERHEKHMKSGERERSQHEKYQLSRLLDDLRGPDWLKTLGISGITDSEKKRYEPKRALVIQEIKALINKFDRWKEEEKRRKAERDQALAEEAEAAEQEESEDESEDEVANSERSASTAPSTRQGPDSSEIDELASAQLLGEARGAKGASAAGRLGVKDSSSNKRRRRNGVGHSRTTSRNDSPAKHSASVTLPPPPPPPPPPEKPITSFFAKRHLRDAAIAGRQRGRTVLAFGHPIPEMVPIEEAEVLEEGVPAREFRLPQSILTEDAIRASQRSGRRRRRDTDAAAA